MTRNTLPQPPANLAEKTAITEVKKGYLPISPGSDLGPAVIFTDGEAKFYAPDNRECDRDIHERNLTDEQIGQVVWHQIGYLPKSSCY